MALGHPLRAALPPDPLGRGIGGAELSLGGGQGGRGRALAPVEAVLGHRFRDPSLLEEALTHASAVDPGRGRGPGRVVPAGRRSNERLEFLGDRVLGLLVAHLLIERFPDDAEGDLTHRHVALVQKGSLAEVGARLGLGAWLEVAPGEADTGGREKPAILADACEAALGAIYLDGGIDAARRFVERHWEPLLARVAAPPRDAKTTLQELAQARGLGLPAYRLLGSAGPPHAQRFTAEASLPGLGAATGEGASKRAAEREAARLLLARIGGGEDAADA